MSTIKQIAKISGPRYERKYFINDLSINEVKILLKLNPFHFSEIFSTRHINNIYYDTKSYQCLEDNILGISKRFKVRLRWYGKSNENVNPNLEIKIKKGLLGKKRTLSLEEITLNEINTKFPNLKKFSKSLNLDLSEFIPTLINSYTRTYYLSQDKKIRITIDSNQTFGQIIRGVPIRRISDKSSIILELKYEKGNNNLATQVSQFFPFRLSKSSKYVRGLNIINGKDL